jgi:transposase InsO family protein
MTTPRYALSVTAWNRVTGPIVLATFRATVAAYGAPASTLTDNGMVFTTRLSGGKGGRNGFEHELRRLGIKQKNSRPNHPQTQGKAERFQQTLRTGWQPKTPARHPYRTPGPSRRLHRHPQPPAAAPLPAAPGHPATAYQARPKAAPGTRGTDTHNRVRTDRLDANGTVTLRHGGRLYHIGTGRAHARTHVLLVQDLHIRIINAATGELLRELILDPSKNYQPTGRPLGPPPGTPRPPRKRRNSEP